MNEYDEIHRKIYDCLVEISNVIVGDDTDKAITDMLKEIEALGILLLKE